MHDAALVKDWESLTHFRSSAENKQTIEKIFNIIP